jgi:hypothetical protein
MALKAEPNYAIVKRLTVGQGWWQSSSGAQSREEITQRRQKWQER